VDDFLARYDSRAIGQYVADNGVLVSPADLQTNTNLLAILTDASAMLEAAALVGGRYRPADLNNLISSSLVGAGLIKRIVSDLAMGLLRKRRGMSEDQPFPAFEDALRQLELLRKGEVIFPFLEVEEAGNAQDTFMTEVQMYQQGRLSAIFTRYFGNRVDQQSNDC
jgi:phage gp36-like protein